MSKNVTKIALIKKMYLAQKSHSKQREHLPPEYSLEELIDKLMLMSLFHKLFSNWEKSNYKKDLIPSIDRKSNLIGYTKENIQLGTWKFNRQKNYSDVKKGIDDRSLIPVSQFNIDIEGAFVMKYISANEASRQTGINSGNILRCCNELSKTAGGFCWEFT